MNKGQRWINRKVRWGAIQTTAGILFLVAGIILEWRIQPLTFNPKNITSVGIMLFIIGVVCLMRYLPARRNSKEATRLTAEDHDERMIGIRARAGYRAYILSAALTVVLTFWVGGAHHRGEPVMSSDTVWYYLVALILLPICFYVGSIMYDARR